MKVNKKCLMIVLTVVLAAVVLCAKGCKKRETASAASVELCTMCGQVKGSELCCKPNQVKCAGCGLTKGSLGCCKIPEGAKTAAICATCGQIKETSLCCKPNEPTCPKCGLVKGSPGCCKIHKL